MQMLHTSVGALRQTVSGTRYYCVDFDECPPQLIASNIWRHLVPPRILLYIHYSTPNILGTRKTFGEKQLAFLGF
ncbi:hypothetical protein BJV77DRAFT_1039006, partial [Russula vinacea]